MTQTLRSDAGSVMVGPALEGPHGAYQDHDTSLTALKARVTPCFTPGTAIATPSGERPVEDLKAGDLVITRDNGIQAIRWAGRRDLTTRQLGKAHELQPVLLRQGSLGDGLPERDMRLSPNHRVLVANDRTPLYFNEVEVFVAAKNLINHKGIEGAGAGPVSYIHFICDRHEAVLSNGCWSESFQPTDQALAGLRNAQRTEILDIFPELRSTSGEAAFPTARKDLSEVEARALQR